MRSRKNYQKIDSINSDNSLLIDDDIIPYSILEIYFPIPEGIRKEEFWFIQSKHFINFFSTDDHDKIERADKYMKGRPELDAFKEKYDLKKSFKQPFVNKSASINPN